MILKILIVFGILVSFPFLGRAQPNDVFLGTIRLSPYIVSIQRTTTRFDHVSYHWCTGSIIKPDTVVTSTHCVMHPVRNPVTAEVWYRQFQTSDLVVVSGWHYVSNNCNYSRKYVEGRKGVKVLKIFRGPKYDPSESYDVALLKIPPFTIVEDSQIEKIDIPTASYYKGKSIYEMFKNMECVTFGYKSPFNRTFGPVLYLHKINLTIGKNEECNRAYKDYDLEKRVQNNQLCTHTTEKEFCKVDLGAPLVCDNKLIGISNRGPYCNETQGPGIWDIPTDDERNYHTFVPEKQKSLEPVVFIKNIGLKPRIANIFLIQAIYSIYKIFSAMATGTQALS